MPEPLTKFAPYFFQKTARSGFVVISRTEKIAVFSKGIARMHVEVALKKGKIRKDESLELFRQINTSEMNEKMDMCVCMIVLEKLNEVYGESFSRDIFHPSMN